MIVDIVVDLKEGWIVGLEGMIDGLNDGPVGMIDEIQVGRLVRI